MSRSQNHSYSTSQNLLKSAAEGSQAAWTRLDLVYRPFIRRWLDGLAIPNPDAEDLCQEILTKLTQKLPEFQHNGNRGAFRAWLRVVTVNQVREFWRKKRPDTSQGGSEVLNHLQQLESPGADLQVEWDRQHDLFIVNLVIQEIQSEFEQTTLAAFHGVAVENRPASDVASELGISTGAVYIAKSRVLKRLREIAGDLLH